MLLPVVGRPAKGKERLVSMHTLEGRKEYSGVSAGRGQSKERCSIVRRGLNAVHCLLAWFVLRHILATFFRFLAFLIIINV